MVIKSILFAGLIFTSFACAESGQQEETGTQMNNQQLEKLIKRISEKVEGRPGLWQFSYKDIGVYVVTDEKADRMRIMSPIADEKDLDKERLQRLMQANFDAALDARYAIAKGKLWSVFIHPLSHLSEHEFFSGLGQTLNLVATYGTTFSSGALVFRGGDSEAANREYYQSIIDKGLSI